MIYSTLPPSLFLSHIVDYYWHAKIDLCGPACQHYATPLLEGIAFNFNQGIEQHCFNNQTHNLNKSAYVFGQPTSPRVVMTNAKGVDIIAIKFKPLGLYKITGIKMQYIADTFVPLEDIWGCELTELCDMLQEATDFEKAVIVLEAFLIKKSQQTNLHYRIDSVAEALQLINASKGAVTIKQIQSATNTTRKTLERAFMDYMGLLPKLYSRIIRFNAIKEIMDKAAPLRPAGSSLALDYGFYDSSHFSAEFRHFAGCTPQAYLKSTPLHLVFKDV